MQNFPSARRRRGKRSGRQTIRLYKILHRTDRRCEHTRRTMGGNFPELRFGCPSSQHLRVGCTEGIGFTARGSNALATGRLTAKSNDKRPYMTDSPSKEPETANRYSVEPPGHRATAFSASVPSAISRFPCDCPREARRAPSSPEIPRAACSGDILSSDQGFY